jgi:hypothetical protein
MKRALAIASVMCAAMLGGAWTARTTIPAARVATQGVPDAWAAAGLNTGLVGYWAMRTNTATTVVDEWGTNTGTVVNAPEFGTAYGVRANGVRFVQASNNAISLGTSFDAVLGGSGITVSAWINPTNTVTLPVLYDYSSSGDGAYFFDRRTNGVLIATLMNKTFPNRIRVESLANSAPQGQWTHVAYVWDGTTTTNGITIYANGAKAGVSAASAVGTFTRPVRSSLVTNAVRMGAFSNDAGFGDGTMDEMAVWSRALSSNEVYQLYSTPLYAPYK